MTSFEQTTRGGNSVRPKTATAAAGKASSDLKTPKQEREAEREGESGE